MTNALQEIADKLVGVDVTELPAVTAADVGKILTVNAEGKWVAAAPASQLPAVTSSDSGKVLTVSAQGAWGAAALPE
jgi:hypothetical protein